MLRGELGREARLSACRVTDTCRDQSLPSVGPGVWARDSQASLHRLFHPSPAPQPGLDLSPAAQRACASLVSHPFFTGQPGTVGSLSWASWPPCRGLWAAPSCQDPLPTGHAVQLLCPLAGLGGLHVTGWLGAGEGAQAVVGRLRGSRTCHVHRMGGRGSWSGSWVMCARAGWLPCAGVIPMALGRVRTRHVAVHSSYALRSERHTANAFKPGSWLGAPPRNTCGLLPSPQRVWCHEGPGTPCPGLSLAR